MSFTRYTGRFDKGPFHIQNTKDLRGFAYTDPLYCAINVNFVLLYIASYVLVGSCLLNQQAVYLFKSDTCPISLLLGRGLIYILCDRPECVL